MGNALQNDVRRNAQSCLKAGKEMGRWPINVFEIFKIGPHKFVKSYFSTCHMWTAWHLWILDFSFDTKSQLLWPLSSLFHFYFPRTNGIGFMHDGNSPFCRSTVRSEKLCHMLLNSLFFIQSSF